MIISKQTFTPIQKLTLPQSFGKRLPDVYEVMTSANTLVSKCLPDVEDVVNSADEVTDSAGTLLGKYFDGIPKRLSVNVWA